MAGLSCAFDSAAALRRVFIPSARDAPKCVHVPRILVPALLAPSRQQQTRCLTETRCLREDYSSMIKGSRAQPDRNRWGSDSFKKPSNASPVPTAANPARRPPPQYAPKSQRPSDVKKKTAPRVKTKLARLPRDEEILAQYVYLQETDADGLQETDADGLQETDAEGNEVRGNEVRGRLQPLQEVLRTLDRKLESLQVVVNADPMDPDAPQYPIAVIVNKKDELARIQKEKDKQKKSAAANKEKELEVTWAMAPHDVDHKLRTLQKFLANGWKVQLLILKKDGKGVKTASKKQADELLLKLTETIAAVPGSKEWKGREGHILGTMRVFLQGKRQAKEKKEVFLSKADQKAAREEKRRMRKNKEGTVEEELGEEPGEEPGEQQEGLRDGNQEEDIEEDPVEIISRRL